MERGNISSMGLVSGRYGKELMLCTLNKKFYTMGCIWLGCNPYSYVFPVILTQLLLFTLLFRILYFWLKRFGQSSLNCQILAGMVLGKSCFGTNEIFRKIFLPPESRMTIETLADFGFICHLFVIGIHIDLGLVKKMGKDAVAVGVASFLTPFLVCMISLLYLQKTLPTNDIYKYSLVFLIMAISMTSFAGTSNLLSDLHILNSDIGRLATLAAMVNDACNCLLFIAVSAITASKKQKESLVLWSILWQSMLFAALVFAVRPLMVRFARSLPGEGKILMGAHFLAILVTAFLFGFLFNIGGMPTGIGCLLYGTVIPGGPPLGSALVNKLDTITAELFLPSKFGLAGFDMSIFEFEVNPIEMAYLGLIMLGYFSKFLGVVVSGFFFNKISLWDSFALGLVMCCRGVVEASIYISLRESGRISVQAFDSLVLSMLMVTGIARPVVSKLYDPWGKLYAGQEVYSILQSDQRQLRALVCIHMEDNVQPIIDLLSALNPTRESPFSLTVLNLLELKGRLSAVLEPNVYEGRISGMVSRTRHMANAFDYLVAQSRGSVIVKHFTSIAPYATMHTDICTVAMEVRAHITIIPFHKQKQIDGSYQSNLPVLQFVNQNVLKSAPSTVGLLIDRSQTAGALQPTMNGRKNNYLRIFVLFLGGVDDREALALATRMIGLPKLVNLTLVWLRHAGDNHHHQTDDPDSQDSNCVDAKMIKNFREKIRRERLSEKGGEKVVCYREELVSDAVGTTRVLRSFEGKCDLCMIGRYHPPDSPLTQGILGEWSDCCELGAIGDMLGNSDFTYSVLVIKQHKMENPQFSKPRSFTL